MNSPRVTTRLLALPLAFALATLGACGNGAEDASQNPTPPVNDPGGAGDGDTTTPTAKDPAPDRGRRRELPKVKPLTADKAKGILLAPLGELRDTEEVHATLKYLALLGDRSAVRPIREQLLTKDEDGEYPLGESGAAMGLHVLKLYNEEGLERQIIDVVSTAFDDEFAGPFCVAALSTLKGTSRQKEAEGLLVRMLDSGDETSYPAAAVLVEWGTEGARSAFGQLLGDATKDGDLYVEDELIGAAVSGLVQLDDERGVQFMETLIAEPEGEFAGDAIVEGMAIKDATKVVPYIKRLVEQEIAEDSGDASYAATLALSVIYQDGGGGAHVPFLERVRSELGEPYAGVTLWVLGKDDYASAVAEELKRTVLNIDNYDVSDAVFLLERIADRKAAGDPAFRDLIDVAAQVEAHGKTEAAQQSARIRQRALNAAAAYAFLASKK